MPLSIDPELVSASLETAKLSIVTQKPYFPPTDFSSRRAHSLYKFLSVTAYPRQEDVTIKEFHTTAPDGHQILLKWYAKANSTPGSAVLFAHGGGFIVGEASWTDNLLTYYVSLSGVPMLSVDYRLAPEAKYPVPVLDMYTALQWLHAHAEELGVDTARIGIAGDSAGGGLAAACTIMAKEKGGPGIAKQILLYPMLDDRNVLPKPHISQFVIWTNVDNEIGWTAMLCEQRGKEDVSPTAAPGRLEDASGMPSLYIDIPQLDHFADEDLEYAGRHVKAGVQTEIHFRPGVTHGYELAAPKSEVAKRCISDRVKAFRSI